jgi:pSer/pThr/pTyr-binding forkhead associated (FHA) protein
MITHICTQCKKKFQFDETLVKLKPQQTSIRLGCPSCKTFNNIHLNQQTTMDIKPPMATPSPVAAQPPVNTNPNPTPPVYANETVIAEIGWLIVHDENTPKQTFSLKEGINTIGRYNTTVDTDIPIQTADGHMSRRHCVVEVKRVNAFQFEYKLYDIGKLTGIDSTNGTFVNAREKLISRRLPNGKIVYTEVCLEDGYTIQLGRTKLILKTPTVTQNRGAAENVVSQTNFSKTIIM